MYTYFFPVNNQNIEKALHKRTILDTDNSDFNVL